MTYLVTVTYEVADVENSYEAVKRVLAGQHGMAKGWTCTYVVPKPLNEEGHVLSPLGQRVRPLNWHRPYA